MKKFLPLLFIMSVIGAVRADIASTNYVDNKAATKEALGGVRMTTYRDMVDAMIDALAGGPNIETVYPNDVPFVFDARDVLNNNVTLDANKQDAINPSMVCETGSDGVAICNSVDPADIKKNAVVTINSNGTVVPTAPGAGLTVDDDGTLSASIEGEFYNGTTDHMPEDGMPGHDVWTDNGVLKIPFAHADVSSNEWWPGVVNIVDSDEALQEYGENVTSLVPSFQWVEDTKQDKLGGEDGEGTPFNNRFVTLGGNGEVHYSTVIDQQEGGFVTGVTVNNGNVELARGDYALPTATDRVLGGVKIGDNIDVNNGTISVPEASMDESGYPVPGVVPVAGSYTDVDEYPGEDKSIIVPNIELTQRMIDSWLTNMQDKINTNEICNYVYDPELGYMDEKCEETGRTYVDGDGFVVIKDGEVIPVDVEEDSGDGFVSSISVDMGADDKPHLYINKSGLPTASATVKGVAKWGEVPIKENGNWTATSAQIWIE